MKFLRISVYRAVLNHILYMSMFCRKCVKYSSTKILLFHQDIIFFKTVSLFTVEPLYFYVTILIFHPWCRKAGTLSQCYLGYLVSRTSGAWHVAFSLVLRNKSRSPPSVAVSPAQCRRCPGSKRAAISCLAGVGWPAMSKRRERIAWTAALCYVPTGPQLPRSNQPPAWVKWAKAFCFLSFYLCFWLHKPG